MNPIYKICTASVVVQKFPPHMLSLSEGQCASDPVAAREAAERATAL